MTIERDVVDWTTGTSRCGRHYDCGGQGEDGDGDGVDELHVEGCFEYWKAGRERKWMRGRVGVWIEVAAPYHEMFICSDRSCSTCLLFKWLNHAGHGTA
jgi:hypothetical protein